MELVPPCFDDVGAILVACRDPEIQNWVPIPVPYRYEDALEYASVHTDQTWEAGAELTWAIRLSVQLAGSVGLYRVANSSGNLGFWMDPAFRGRGILTEACGGVRDFAFSPAPAGLGLIRVGWNAGARNIGSARVAQKLGVHIERTARLGAALRGELRVDWAAGLLLTDDRSVQNWPILD